MRINFKYPGVIVIILISLLACNPPGKDPEPGIAKITGQVKGISDTTLSFDFEQYTLLSSSQSIDIELDKTGHFELVLETTHPIKGFLSFGKIPKTYKFGITQVNGKDTSMQVPSVDFRMIYLYLSPGDSVYFTVDRDNIEKSLKFTGTGAENNLFINREEWTFNNYKSKYLNNYYNITYLQADAYKITKSELHSVKKSFLDDFKSQNRLSEHLVKVYQNQYDQELTRALIYYPAGHAGFNNDKYPELPDDYYDFMDQVSLPENVDDLGPGAYYFLNTYLRKKHDLSAADNTKIAGFYEYVNQELPERLSYVFKAYALDRDFKKEIYDLFAESCPYPEIADLVKRKYQHLEGMLEGSPGPDFILSDIDNKLVELEDLKGNYVYIDFWATWCKPCIKEIPSLELLQEEFQKDPIKFVSISIDKASDTLKWKNFVLENDMKGIQLWADSEHHEMFSRSLNIKSIPRFVMLDQEGRIIDAQAPRPSDPETRTILNNLVNH